jgi:alpha-tubulin suppressor-like RCC1 family protein
MIVIKSKMRTARGSASTAYLLIVSFVGVFLLAPSLVALSIPATGAVAAGASHTLALKADRTVWAWGGNANGQLGDGTTTSRTTPTSIAGLSNVVAVAAGASHTIAVRADGTLLTWGANGSGQLGDGTSAQKTLPVQVGALGNVVARCRVEELTRSL